MAEFEELQLRVTLTDQASRPLQQIEEQYRRLSTGPTAGHMERFKREGNYLKEGIKLLGLEAKGASAHFETLAGRAGLAAGAVAAAGFAVYEATKKVAEFATTIRDVGRFAEELGTSYAHVKNITDQMAKLGIAEEKTRQNITAGMRAHVEAEKKLWPDYIENVAHILNQGGPELAKELQALNKAATLPEEQQRAAIQFNQRIAQYYREHRLAVRDEDNEEMIKQKQRDVLIAQGYNTELMHVSHVDDLTKEQEDRLNKMAENAAEIAKNWDAIWVNIGKVKDLFVSNLFDPESSSLPAMLKHVKELTDSIFQSILKGEGSVSKSLWNVLIPYLPDYFTKPVGPVEMKRGGAPWSPTPGTPFRFAGDDNLPASQKFGDNSEKTDENTRELKKLNDQLYQLLNPTDKSGNLAYGGGALGDRASGSNYTTGSGDTTGRTVAPPTTPQPAPLRTLPGLDLGPSSGSFASPFGSFLPNKGVLPNAPGLTNPPASTMAPPVNPGGSMMGGDFGSQTLREQRGGYLDELSDPKVRDRLYSMTQAEVGGQGTNAEVQWQESLFNRARSRGQTLWDAMHGLHSKQNPEGYWPQATLTKADRAPTEAESASGELAMRQVLMGSNRSNLATGNASGTVGFAGGPETSRITVGKKVFERFGIEGPDKGWANETRLAMGAEGMHSVRTTLDKGVAGQQGAAVESIGRIHVEVADPMKHGTAAGNTLFNKTPMERQIQQMPTQVGPAEPARAAAIAG
jgi:hypothetical protein